MQKIYFKRNEIIGLYTNVIQIDKSIARLRTGNKDEFLSYFRKKKMPAFVINFLKEKVKNDLDNCSNIPQEFIDYIEMGQKTENEIKENISDIRDRLPTYPKGLQRIKYILKRVMGVYYLTLEDLQVLYFLLSSFEKYLSLNLEVNLNEVEALRGPLTSICYSCLEPQISFNKAIEIYNQVDHYSDAIQI